VVYVKGKILDITPAAEHVAVEYLVDGVPPQLEAEVVGFDDRLSPPARLYQLSGLPGDCRVQLNYAGPPDVDRLRLLMETDLAEVLEVAE